MFYSCNNICSDIDRLSCDFVRERNMLHVTILCRHIAYLHNLLWKQSRVVHIILVAHEIRIIGWKFKQRCSVLKWWKWNFPLFSLIWSSIKVERIWALINSLLINSFTNCGNQLQITSLTYCDCYRKRLKDEAWKWAETRDVFKYLVKVSDYINSYDT